MGYETYPEASEFNLSSLANLSEKKLLDDLVKN